MNDEVRKSELIAFLRSGAERHTFPDGGHCTRQEAQAILRELISPVIEVRSVCSTGRGIVIAAPHVSFDHWSEYFCNRAAARLAVGRVVAKHFRDQDHLHIPISIGRHIHVNRPLESDGPGEAERVTERAHQAYEEYLAALWEAGGGVWPLNLLIEFHSHRQSPVIEIATQGVEQSLASELWEHWQQLRRDVPDLPELRIEPVHELRFRAAGAKNSGSMQPQVTTRALHIEIPRGARRSEALRQLANGQILSFLDYLLIRLHLESAP